MTMPTISIGTSWDGPPAGGVGASGVPAPTVAAPVVGTSRVSTTRALACTAPPSCRSPTGSLRARYNPPPHDGVAGRLRSRRFGFVSCRQ